MKIDRFIDPIFANVAEYFGVLKPYNTIQDFNTILRFNEQLRVNNVHIYRYASDCVFLIDIEQSIKVLAAFNNAVRQEDPTFTMKDFLDNWYSPVCCYYKTIIDLNLDAKKMLNAIGPKIFSNYGLDKILDSLESIARQYSIESSGLFCRKNKRAYRNQAVVLIKQIEKMGITPRSLVNIR